ncbi:hypothetical protein GGQ61_001268 [Phenylobacterium haematophilum]|uniref:Uncharacterized protein n=1 Tax=Phenylobacterium haematophilum TaxID=98513 RepID=A0A839ZYX9_9CAUL|nr:hypothetical protein [Phenylobacterium haematophilum]MBB3890551.1 hypothetical protein [Phenylobacterium haematophilum]
MSNGVSTVTLDHLIQAALTGQPYNQQRLGAEAERYSLRLSRAKAPDLPDDLHDEVCLQAFVELLKLGAGALTKHSGRILFRRAVLAAIRSVRASYAPPGERTRTPRRENVATTSRAAKLPAPPKVAAEHIGHIASPQEIESNSFTEGDFAFIDFDRFRDLRQEAELQRVEDRIEADAVLKRAAPEVARGLRLVHLSDETIEEAAVKVGLSRFVLKRRMDAFCSDLQAAA